METVENKDVQTNTEISNNETSGLTGEPLLDAPLINAKEQPEGEKIDEPTGEPKTPEEVQYDIENFNKFFETKYENSDQIKSDLANLNRIKEFDDLKTNHEKMSLSNKELADQIESMKKERDELLDFYSVEKQFGSLDNYKNLMIMHKMEQEGKNPNIVKIALLDDISDIGLLEMAMYGEGINIPDMGENEARDLVLRKLGVTEDRYEEIESENGILGILKPGEKGILRQMANEARTKLLAIKNTEIPEYGDFAKQQASQKEQVKAENDKLLNEWSDSISKIKNSITSVQFLDESGNVEFEKTIDKEVIDKFPDWAKERIIKEKIAYTEENINKLQERFIDEYGQKMWREIANSKAKAIETKLTEEYFKKTHNVTPVNTEVNKEKIKTDIKTSQREAFGYPVK